MTDPENIEWGDLVNVKYNSGVSGVREQKTGHVLAIDHAGQPRSALNRHAQNTVLTFHPVNVSQNKAPVYQAHFGELVDSFVEKTDKRFDSSEAAKWVRRGAAKAPNVKWEAVSSSQTPELIVSVFPSIRNRVYSDL